MKRTRPVYCMIIDDPRERAPLIWEQYIDLTKEELALKAAEFTRTHEGVTAWIVELPIQVSTSVQRVAGSIEKVDAVLIDQLN